MKNGISVSHIVVKPSQTGISTNLLVHTDKRTYNLDFTTTENSQYIRGVAFSYQTNDLTAIFTKSQQDSAGKKPLEDELQLGTDGLKEIKAAYPNFIEVGAKQYPVLEKLSGGFVWMMAKNYIEIYANDTALTCNITTTDREAVSGFYVAYETVQVIYAAYMSAYEGRRVKIK